MGLQAKHLGIFGASGSGKTVVLRKMLLEKRRVIVLDAKSEFHRFRGYKKHIWKGRTAFAKELLEMVGTQFKLAIVLPIQSSCDWEEVADDVALVLMHAQEGVNQGRSQRIITVVFEEADTSLPVNAKNAKYKNARRLSLQGRSFGIEMVVVSQRPTMINKSVRGQFAAIVSFRLSNVDDQNDMEKALGPRGKGAVTTLPEWHFVRREMNSDDISLWRSSMKAKPKLIEHAETT